MPPSQIHQPDPLPAHLSSLTTSHPAVPDGSISPTTCCPLTLPPSYVRFPSVCQHNKEYTTCLRLHLNKSPLHYGLANIPHTKHTRNRPFLIPTLRKLIRLPSTQVPRMNGTAGVDALQAWLESKNIKGPISKDMPSKGRYRIWRGVLKAPGKDSHSHHRFHPALRRVYPPCEGKTTLVHDLFRPRGPLSNTTQCKRTPPRCTIRKVPLVGSTLRVQAVHTHTRTQVEEVIGHRYCHSLYNLFDA